MGFDAFVKRELSEMLLAMDFPTASSFAMPVLMRVVPLLLFPFLSCLGEEPRRIDGYKGIWFDLGQRSEFGSKYSGGLGTYTAKHGPIAV